MITFIKIVSPEEAPAKLFSDFWSINEFEVCEGFAGTDAPLGFSGFSIVSDIME
jgi:hypothetical protein